MISKDVLEKIAIKYQAPVYPNILREYCQHLFLSELYKLPESKSLLFKGGTALRIIYESPRFSEDLDFSCFGVNKHQLVSYIEKLLLQIGGKMEKMGFDLKFVSSNKTSGGYFGSIEFFLYDFKPIAIEINVSLRQESPKSEMNSIASDFIPTYNIIHLGQENLVNEKVFGALLDRKKPRDFYDLYFIMRKNMLSLEQKKKLKKYQKEINEAAQKINFKAELQVFLPADHQMIIRDFYKVLIQEIGKQIA